LSGKFPGCVLYLTLGLGAVDVNVHPAKTEVKFVEEKRVFDGVYYGVLSALEQGSFLPELTLSRDTQKVLHTPLTPTPQEARPSGAGIYQPPVSPDTGMLQDVGAVLYQGRIPLPNTMPAPESTPYRIISTHPVGTAAPGRPLHASDVVEGWHRPQTVEADGDEAGINTGAEETATPDEGRGRPGAVVPTEDSTPVLEGQDDVGLVPYRVVGEALGTYILVEQGDTLRFIDKHAAHERIIFDRLRAGDYTAMAQALLTPMTVDLGPEHTAVLMDHQEILEGFGFELTQFGQGTVALRQVPGDIDLDEMAGFLTELAAGLALGRTPNPNDIRDEVFHTMACKAAIKAGRRSEPEDLHALAGQVLDGTVQYCPHGRPVSMILTRDVLDKQVKRG
ncbi:MAG: hypothetical protein FWC72_00700, partial [Oscillospiraceae bacterium]|nr:hypothetical protein [Oscillospiraceae bacterium]